MPLESVRSDFQDDATTFAIVVPTLNEENNIDRLLASLRRQTNTEYSIVVVDQGSDDRTVEVARSYGCKVVKVPRPSFYTPPAQSRNIGAWSVAGTVLVHLDADMELATPDFLDRLARLLDADHRAAIIQECDVATGFWTKCKALERRCYRGTEMEAARAVSRDLFLQVGGYDEKISSGEDFFITRLYERETKVARDPSLVVRHHIGRYSLGSLLRKKVAYGRSAKTYLVQAPRIGARSATSIIGSSLRAYLKNWRLLGAAPAHYLCIFPLRATEWMAVQLGIWLGPGSG